MQWRLRAFPLRSHVRSCLTESAVRTGVTIRAEQNPRSTRRLPTRRGEFIDECGAQVSEKHCNFLLNLGTASSADIEALGEEVRRRVMERCNINLEWEIQRIGVDG